MLKWLWLLSMFVLFIQGVGAVEKKSAFLQFGETKRDLGRASEAQRHPLDRLTERELLQRMDALPGSVTWSTWGSKLENIFSSVFSTIPNLNHAQVRTDINDPLVIDLSGGLSKQFLNGWRDNMSYVVTTKPAHGDLNETVTTQDALVYTPKEDYSGSDFFTYFLQLGTSKTAPATISITIGTVSRRPLTSGKGRRERPPIAADRSVHNPQDEDEDDADDGDEGDVEMGDWDRTEKSDGANGAANGNSQVPIEL